ncbi:MAG: hotdog family protein [Paraperlucidibaca sp.]|nr:hotdog family protein [Paraperlucidibaca sp.]MBQ0841615.1 hotdog family protein [Paraperlucidibaca sp.]
MRQHIDCLISELVPHAGRMCLLDRAIEADAESLSAELVIRSDNPFIQAQGVPGWVGIEYMAQAIAAWAGWQARLQGQAPRIGFLLGSRRFQCHQPWFAIGDVLRIEVRLQFQADNGLGQFDCQIHCADVLAAEAALTVFETSEPQQFINRETS